MKYIGLKQYKKNMGVFINMSNDKNIVDGCTNYDYDDLVVNYSEYLNKNTKYYLYCNGGVKSRKLYNLLDYKGYDVTVVLK